jgi:hypothetical protein
MPTRHGREVDVTVLRPLRVETLQYMLSKHAADYARYDGRSKSWKPIDPPKDALLSLLNIGHWDFPGIAGVVNSPTLRPDGSILSEVGYDAKTKLWCGIDRDLTLPPVPDKPTKEQALAALNLLKRLFCESAFIDNLDRSVALAAMLSAVVRGAFDVAPMTLFKAHSPGSGKSFIVDVIAYLVTGRAAPVITASRSIDEMEKRIGSLILESVPLVSLDNATIDLGGELLCQVTERPTVKTRILGKSETPECEWRGSIYATGNNITFIGDMTRRGLVCNVDAGVEQPELRHFEFDPIADVLADRGKYLAAALTIVRAFLVSGEKVECDPLGSYGGWSRFVREPLLWLGEPDPVASMKQLRADDPERSAAHALVELWAEHLEKAPRSYKVNEIIRLANEGEMEINAQGVPERMYVRHALHDLLLTEAGGTGNREIDPRRLGKWLGRLNGAVYGSWRIRKVRHSNSHGDDWALEVAPGRATPSD